MFALKNINIETSHLYDFLKGDIFVRLKLFVLSLVLESDKVLLVVDKDEHLAILAFESFHFGI